MWKLVILNGDEIVTGEPLKDYLTSIGFFVPETLPADLIQEPERPTPLTFPVTAEQYYAYKTALYAYIELKASVALQNKEKTAKYLQQFKDFADELADMFVIATRVKIAGKWQLQIVPPKYTFLQAAQKLMGYGVTKPDDPIEFIANNYF